jgi:hypothetical protein
VLNKLLSIALVITTWQVPTPSLIIVPPPIELSAKAGE